MTLHADNFSRGVFKDIADALEDTEAGRFDFGFAGVEEDFLDHVDRETALQIRNGDLAPFDFAFEFSHQVIVGGFELRYARLPGHLFLFKLRVEGAFFLLQKIDVPAQFAQGFAGFGAAVGEDRFEAFNIGFSPQIVLSQSFRDVAGIIELPGDFIVPVGQLLLLFEQLGVIFFKVAAQGGIVIRFIGFALESGLAHAAGNQKNDGHDGDKGPDGDAHDGSSWVAFFFFRIGRIAV